MFLLEIIRSSGEMGKAGELRFIVSVLCLETKGAFDHVDHARLIETLRKKGIPGQWNAIYTTWGDTAALFAYQCFPIDWLNWFREHMELRDCKKENCMKGVGKNKSKGQAARGEEEGLGDCGHD